MPRTISRLIGLVGICLLLSAIPAGALGGLAPLEPETPLPSAEDGQMTNESTNLWFVQLKSKPTIEGTKASTIAAEQKAFRASAAKAKLQYTERFAYSSLFNGIAMEIDPAQASELGRIAGVSAVFPVLAIDVPETGTISPELATALAMTGADIVHNELGYTGDGVRVAVMDTGIDYDHPDLGGCFGAGCRVEAGWDFVGDAFNFDDTSPDYNPIAMPDADPDDCNGHGTHVAGIIGANGEVVGVAPEVTFGAYRVFGCEGSTSSDIMLAAMERALADDMDILNMSIGSAFTWPQYPTAQGANRLVERGMIVVASIGNSGANGVYGGGAPGLAEKVIGVASFDNSHINALTFTVNPSGASVPYLQLATTTEAPTSGTTPELVYVGRGCNIDDYLGDPNGKVALIQRGACTFNEKYQRAVDAGAVGVVIFNNVTGLFAGGGVTDRGVWGIGISNADGQAILAQLASGPVTLTFTDERIDAVNPTGGLISSFSSFGPAPDLTLKPDIAAPGGLIRSTYPLELGGYAIISGTSMAAPHVAGVAALMVEARPDLHAMGPGAIADVLRNTADPKNWWGNPGLGFLDNVHRQGAGMVDADGAVQAEAIANPSKLALGESESGPVTKTITVRNLTGSAVTYDLGHTPALSTGGNTFVPSFFTGFADVQFSKQGTRGRSTPISELTVPANGIATFSVTITANAELPDGSIYGGYIELWPDANGEVEPISIPYAGFKGDYQAIQAITDPGFGLPAVGINLGGGFFDIAPEGYVFTMQDEGSIPYILIHLDHQLQDVIVNVHNVNTGQVYTAAITEEFLARNSTSTGFFAIPWDGKAMAGRVATSTTVPDGQYVFELTATKALGDPNNPAHVETWTSTMFEIDRPGGGSR